MGSSKLPKTIMVLALVIGAAGVLMSWASYQAWPDTEKHLKRKAQDLKTLYGMRSRLGVYKAAFVAFESLPSKSAVPLREIVTRALPGTTVDLREREPRKLQEGWTLHSMEVSLELIPFEQLGALFLEAEQSRPPWRLKELTLGAGAGASAGQGRATLVMECLEQRL